LLEIANADSYGYKNVVTPGDIFTQNPTTWPFSLPFLNSYRSFSRPLPRPIDSADPSKSLKIDAIFVYNDPRDWGLDASIIIDLLLSRSGILGTVSSKNNNPALPNRGYLQDNQPPLYFSNPDLWWAAKFHLPRLGQGAFRESLEGIWDAVTGGEEHGVELKKVMMGKPYKATYDFAEEILMQHRKALFPSSNLLPLENVYMIGDNPGRFAMTATPLYVLIRF
jgi:HAD superfamily hydrolase (TIGR01456 family)